MSRRRLAETIVQGAISATRVSLPRKKRTAIGPHTTDLLSRSGSAKSFARDSLVLRVVEKVSKEMGIGKQFLGLTFQSTFDSPARALVQNVLTNKDLKRIADNFVKLQKTKAQPSANEFAGQVVVVANGDIKIATTDEIREARVVMTTGLGGSENAGRIIKNFAILKRLSPEGAAGKSVAYIPVDEGSAEDRRYILGAMPYVDPLFLNHADARNFFDRILSKKFLDEKGNLLPAEECGRYLKINHSIAAREDDSHMRWFKSFLIERGISEEDAIKYMRKILRFNIASPLINQRSEKGLPPKILVLSVLDSGSKKPEDSLAAISLNADLYKPGLVSKFRFDDDPLTNKILYILGPGVVPASGLRPDGTVVSDPFGHSPETHIEALTQDDKLAEILEVCEQFLDRDISDDQVCAKLKTVEQEAQPYPTKLESLSEKDREEALKAGVRALLLAWRDALLLHEDGMKKVQLSQTIVEQGSNHEPLCSEKTPEVPQQVGGR